MYAVTSTEEDRRTRAAQETGPSHPGWHLVGGTHKESGKPEHKDLGYPLRKVRSKCKPCGRRTDRRRLRKLGANCNFRTPGVAVRAQFPGWGDGWAGEGAAQAAASMAAYVSSSRVRAAAPRFSS